MPKSILQMELDSEEFPIGIFSQSNYMSKKHHHIEYELFFLDKGQVQFTIDNNSYTLSAGDAIFIEPESEHFCKKIVESDEYHYYALVFDVSIFGGSDSKCRKIFDSIKINRLPKFPPSIFVKIQQCVQYRKNNHFGSDLMTKTLLLEIMSYIIETNQYAVFSTMPIVSKKSVSAVESALLFIRGHYKENISMENVLAVTNYSESHFSRLFKDSVGLNVTEYINKYRIERSCLDLIYSHKNITEIATGNGFNNIQYFSRVFKLFMDCTPKQYQKKVKGVIVPSVISSSII